MQKKRLAVFASHFKGGDLPEYVRYYLRELLCVVDRIIFVIDEEVAPKTRMTLESLGITDIWANPHDEYDFGSYKIGYQNIAEDLRTKQVYELVFCNDSCYGPLEGFGKIFEKMDDIEIDFWGITESYEIKYHLQSYFLVFRRKVFLSQEFKQFIEGISRQVSYRSIVTKYEIGLTQNLLSSGFISGSYIKDADLAGKGNPTNFPIKLLELGSGLIKVKYFTYGFAYLSNHCGVYQVLCYLFKRSPIFAGIVLRDLSSRHSNIFAGNSFLIIFKLWLKNNYPRIYGVCRSLFLNKNL